MAWTAIAGCRTETRKQAPVDSAASPVISSAAVTPKASSVVAVSVASSSGPPRTVWIDPHEVTVAAFKTCVDAGVCTSDHFISKPGTTCNYGAAGREDHPMNCVDHHASAAYCQRAGGRLCQQEDWFAGCRGPANQDYPYGDTYQAGACNAVARGPTTTDRGTSPVGAYTTCEGGYAGLYDMVGNVSEWVDPCKGDYCHFYGGAFLDNEPVESFSSCKRFCAGNQRSFRSATIGFRCCYDTEPKVKPR